ncbi:MAG: response regulator transcription factor [Chitinophagaceae bacterium]|nr:response regulator transcription factor [Chitinophagaceae bacterium]
MAFNIKIFVLTLRPYPVNFMLQEKKKIILLIEPNSLLREAYAKFLTIYGYEVIQNSMGTDIDDLRQTKKIDIAIVNVRLNSISGIDVIRTIKNIMPEVKAVGISFTFQTSYAKDLKAAGANAYLLKGTDEKTLLCVLKEVFDDKEYFVTQ